MNILKYETIFKLLIFTNHWCVANMGNIHNKFYQVEVLDTRRKVQ